MEVGALLLLISASLAGQDGICREIDSAMDNLPDIKGDLDNWKRIDFGQMKYRLEEATKILKEKTADANFSLYDYKVLIKGGIGRFIEARSNLYTSLTYGTFRLAEFIEKMATFWHILFSARIEWSEGACMTNESRAKLLNAKEIYKSVKKNIGEISAAIKEMEPIIESEKDENLIFLALDSISAQFQKGGHSEVDAHVKAVNTAVEAQVKATRDAIDDFDYNFFDELDEKITLFRGCEELLNAVEECGKTGITDEEMNKKFTEHGFKAEKEWSVSHRPLKKILWELYYEIKCDSRFCKNFINKPVSYTKIRMHQGKFYEAESMSDEVDASGNGENGADGAIKGGMHRIVLIWTFLVLLSIL